MATSKVGNRVGDGPSDLVLTPPVLFEEIPDIAQVISTAKSKSHVAYAPSKRLLQLGGQFQKTTVRISVNSVKVKKSEDSLMELRPPNTLDPEVPTNNLRTDIK